MWVFGDPERTKRFLFFVFGCTEAALQENSVAPRIFPGGDQPCYTTASNGKTGGVCMQQSCCTGGLYVSNLCPDYGSSVKCCYSDNSCSTACGKTAEDRPTNGFLRAEIMVAVLCQCHGSQQSAGFHVSLKLTHPQTLLYWPVFEEWPFTEPNPRPFPRFSIGVI